MMGLLSFVRKLTGRRPELTEFMERYQVIRAQRKRINDCLVERIPREVLQRGAQRLGMLHQNAVVVDQEEELPILFDYCIFDVRRRRRNVLDAYLSDPAVKVNPEDVEILQAMQRSSYALVVVLKVEKGYGCVVENLFTNEVRFLVDVSISRTSKRGFVFATRIVEFGEFITTGGAPILAARLNNKTLREFRSDLETSPYKQGVDPALIIRRCLRNPEMKHTRYVDEAAG